MGAEVFVSAGDTDALDAKEIVEVVVVGAGVGVGLEVFLKPETGLFDRRIGGVSLAIKPFGAMEVVLGNKEGGQAGSGHGARGGPRPVILVIPTAVRFIVEPACFDGLPVIFAGIEPVHALPDAQDAVLAYAVIDAATGIVLDVAVHSGAGLAARGHGLDEKFGVSAYVFGDYR